MFCPFLVHECRRESCRMWTSVYSDCSLAKKLEDDVRWIRDAEETEKIGLWKATGDLNRTLNNITIRQLLHSSHVSDDEKQMINSLYSEAVRKKEALDLGKVYR